LRHALEWMTNKSVSSPGRPFYTEDIFCPGFREQKTEDRGWKNHPGFSAFEKRASMPKERIMTAIFLLAGFLLALFYLPQFYWAGLMAIVAAVAAGEWGVLAGLGKWGCFAFGGMALLICLGAMLCFPESVALPNETLKILRLPFPGDTDRLLALIGFRVHLIDALWPGIALYFLTAGFWLLSALFWLWQRQDVRRLVSPYWLWRRLPAVGQVWCDRGNMLFLGLLLILATWFAAVQLRAFHPLVLLIPLGIAWVSDTFAHFTGQKFGEKKLCPAISHGKTWASVSGGLAGVLLYGAGVMMIIDANEAISRVMKPGWLILVVFFFLAVGGMMGDLFESLLKQRAGVKNSGNLLPRQGGVLDHIGSLLAILPCFAFSFMLWVLYAPIPRK
jgi:phosphatidate cytidylyltransferase